MMMNKTISVKKVTALILFLTFPLSARIAAGQARDDIQEYLNLKFAAYCKNFPWEEVYVHTDRDEYISGETMWFNSWVFEKPGTRLSERSNLLYFEVLNWTNMPVVRKRILITNGSGPGMALLPDTLSSGDYTVRAYTNWMKNFLPVNCFSKKIKIYNAIKLNPFHKIREKQFDFTNENAKQTLSKAQTGIKAEVISRPDTFYIHISSDNESYKGRADHCYLFIQANGMINTNEKISILPGNNDFPVPKKSLTPGINQITLFNDSGIPFFERYLLTLPDKKQSLSIISDIGSGPRSKSLLEISPEEILPTSLSEAKLSVSITPGFFPDKSADMSDYLIFGSEFGLLPEEYFSKILNKIDVYSTGKLPENVKSRWIDWDIILSGNYPEIKYLPENENHYITGRLLNKGSLAPVPGEYVFMASPGKKAQFMYNRTDKNGDFSFPLPLDNSTRDIIILSERSDSGHTVNIASSFSELYSPAGADSLIVITDIPAYLEKMSVNYQLNRIFDLSSSVPISEAEKLLPVQQNFYGKPDTRLLLDNYIKLPVMEEVFFELLPGVLLRRSSTGYDVEVIDPVGKSRYNMPPGLFIDGIKINNASVLADLDPELVEEIDVVSDKYIVGDYLFFGIVNVITRDGNFNNIDLPEGAVRLNYRITDPSFSYVTPDHSPEVTKSGRIPDLRNTLYWNPSIIPGIDGKIRIEFWTPDYRTDYKVNIQGIARNGTPVSFKKSIGVK